MPGFKNWYLKWKLLALNFIIIFVFSILTIFTTQYMVSNVSDDILESNLSNMLSSITNQIETIRRINAREVQDTQGFNRILREIENGLSGTTIKGDGILAVLDSNTGQWIVHPSAKGQNWSSKHDFIKKMIDSGDGIVHFEMDDSGDKHSAVYRSYKPFNWVIVAIAPVDSNAPSKDDQWFNYYSRRTGCVGMEFSRRDHRWISCRRCHLFTDQESRAGVSSPALATRYHT